MAGDSLNITISAKAAGAKKEIDGTAKSLGGLGSAMKAAAGFGIGFASGTAAATAAIGLLKSALSSAVDLVRESVTEFSDYGDRIAKMAVSAGVGAEALQELEFAAGRGGASAQELDKALQMLARQMIEAEKGSKTAVGAFNAVGISVDDLRGKSPDEVFRLLADGMKTLGPSATATATAMTLLSESGAKLLPTLQGGADGLDAMASRVQYLGGVMSSEGTAKAEIYKDTIGDAEIASAGLRREIGERLAPVMIGLADDVTKVTVSVREMIEKMDGSVPSAASFALVAGKLIGALGGIVPGARTASTAILALGAANEHGTDIIEQKTAALEADKEAEKEALRLKQEAIDKELAHEAAMARAKAAREAQTRAEDDARRAVEGLWNSYKFLGMSQEDAISGRAAEAQAHLNELLAAGLLTLDEWGDRYARIGAEAQASIDGLAAKHEELDDVVETSGQAVVEQTTTMQHFGGAINSTLDGANQLFGAIGGGADDGVKKVLDVTAMIAKLMIQIGTSIATTAATAGSAAAATAATQAASYGVVTAAATPAAVLGSVATAGAAPAAGAAAAIAAIAGIMGAIGSIIAIGDAGLTPEMLAKAVSGQHSAVMVKRGEAVIDPVGTSEITRMLSLQRRAMESGANSAPIQVMSRIEIDGRVLGQAIDSHLIDASERGRSYTRRVQPGTA